MIKYTFALDGYSNSISLGTGRESVLELAEEKEDNT
jgi:hypothetical protein